MDGQVTYISLNITAVNMPPSSPSFSAFDCIFFRQVAVGLGLTMTRTTIQNETSKRMQTSGTPASLALVSAWKGLTAAPILE